MKDGTFMVVALAFCRVAWKLKELLHRILWKDILHTCKFKKKKEKVKNVVKSSNPPMQIVQSKHSKAPLKIMVVHKTGKVKLKMKLDKQ